MSSVKIRLSLPSPTLPGHPLVYCLILEPWGSRAGVAMGTGQPRIPRSPRPRALPKPSDGEEKPGKGLGVRKAERRRLAGCAGAERLAGVSGRW